LIGCGARTESFYDEGDLAGGSFGASSGAPHGGASGVGANAGASFGGANAGASFGGASFGGANAGASFGGANAGASFGGANGGAFPHGGTSFGGFGATSGAAGAFGGFGAIGGDAGEGGSGATGGIVEACMAVSNDSCAQCQCKVCAPQLVSCFSDLGCALIFACVQQTGCQGLSCYTPNNCRPIIDKFGGLTGPSMSQVFGVLTCSVTSQNACGCN
jgi:hypothetical protein